MAQYLATTLHQAEINVCYALLLAPPARPIQLHALPAVKPILLFSCSITHASMLLFVQMEHSLIKSPLRVLLVSLLVRNAAIIRFASPVLRIIS